MDICHDFTTGLLFLIKQVNQLPHAFFPSLLLEDLSATLNRQTPFVGALLGPVHQSQVLGSKVTIPVLPSCNNRRHLSFEAAKNVWVVISYAVSANSGSQDLLLVSSENHVHTGCVLISEIFVSYTPNPKSGHQCLSLLSFYV